MLYFKPNPGPPPESKPPWKHRRLATKLAICTAAVTLIGFATHEAIWMFNKAKNAMWPDPATWPLERMTDQIKTYNLPVTAERMIYIDLDDNTYIWQGKIKPSSWLAKLAKPDGKVRDLSDEEQPQVRYLFVIQRKNQLAILATTSSPNKLSYIRQVLTTGVK